MKKKLLGLTLLALSLVTVLSACKVTVEPNISDTRIRTSWQIPATGEYVVCENRDTWYEFRFDSAVPDRVQTANIVIKGANIGEISTAVDVSSMGSDGSSDFVIELRVPSSTDPYPMATGDDIGTSAIIVVPLPPDAVPAEGGSQRVNVSIRDSRGFLLGGFAPTSFDVWGGC